MVPLLPTLAAETSTSAAAAAEYLTPASPAWITGFLLLILWLTVAAIILGPLIRHFKLEPQSTQFFTGDRPTGQRR